MMIPKLIKLEDFSLRTVSLKDANDLFEICRQPIVTKYLSWEPHKNIEETQFVIKNIYLERVNQGLPLGYVIVDNETTNVIGYIDFVRRTNDDYEIGYYLSPDFWKRKIMTRALGVMIKVAFKHLDANKVTICHDVENIGSQRVIQNNNFCYLETKKQPQLNTLACFYQLERSDCNEF